MTDVARSGRGGFPAAASPAEMRTRSAAVAARLREMILDGELEPGRRLRQIEVAQHFGVSTTPVREAFTMLAQEGFVRQDAHRGVEVFRPTVRDIRENYEIRLALEPVATRAAAERITADDLAVVEDFMVAMERPGVEHSRRAELNREFHFAIYRAADRPQMLDIIERLRRSADAYVKVLLAQPAAGYLDAVLEEHRAIFDALRDHKPRRAEQAMARHLRHNLSEIEAHISDDDDA